MFETFKNQYILRGRLITETGLHIGKGGSLEVAASDNPVIRDLRGWPYIPGSSFKGALRSRVESIVRALADGTTELKACDPLEEGCISLEEIRKWREEGKSSKELDELIQKNSCIVCRIFGSPWLASKVKISDLYLNPTNIKNQIKNNNQEKKNNNEKWLGRIEVRVGVSIDRDTETSKEKRLYDYEVVPPDTSFFLNIRVDNITDEEFGLLMLGLKEFENGNAWIGGICSRGLGKVKVIWDEIEKVEGTQELIQYLQEGHGEIISEKREIDSFISEKIQHFLNLIKRE